MVKTLLPHEQSTTGFCIIRKTEALNSEPIELFHYFHYEKLIDSLTMLRFVWSSVNGASSG